MTTIYKDSQGVYARVGGWIARPNKPTQFNAGDKTEGKHFGGSTIIGIGKLPGRGEYKEYWHTAGTVEDYKSRG
jgi:hypothetical protein